MNTVIRWAVVVYCTLPVLSFSVYGSDIQQQNNDVRGNRTAFQAGTYSCNRDIAFVSVWGSRPAIKKLHNFQRAILYNARGEVVEKIDIGRDSIYSLDKMIQENKARGPLFIRMYRR